MSIVCLEVYEYEVDLVMHLQEGVDLVLHLVHWWGE